MTTPDQPRTAPLPPGVTAMRDRHGKLRWRFRRKGWKTVYLPGQPGDAAFHRAYAQALEAGPQPRQPVATRRAVTPGSLDDLLARLQHSPRWKQKMPKTRMQQARLFARFMDRVDSRGRRYGERPVEAVTVGWLDKVLGTMADTPGAANVLRKRLSELLEYACALEWRTSNPVRHTARYADGPGFHAWTDAEIEQYRAHHPLGTMARLVLELALNTAARRCNVAQLTRDHIQGGRICTDHAKDGNSTSVPMLPATRAALDALPAAPIKHLVVTAHGKPFTVNGLGNRMRDWCNAAGLPGCTMHGLRKAIARQLAESGATDAEGQAVTGHKQPATFAYYRQSANRAALADKAMANLSSQSPGLDNRSDN
jgi:site-specific recombinase XerD